MLNLVRILAVAYLALVTSAAPVFSADLGHEPEIAIPADDLGSATAYLKTRAILHIVRATFDVEATDSLGDLVAADLQQARRTGVSEAEIQLLNTELLAEGSYFLVSLRYLILAGYPAWPDNRSEDAYSRDALAILEPLAAQLHEAIDAGDDPLPVFLAAQKVYWWTEGSFAPTDGRADFGQRDALVEAALAASTARASGNS